jgi:hypothetical protein
MNLIDDSIAKVEGKSSSLKWFKISIFFFILLPPDTVYANSGLPMLAISYPFFLLFLIPIVCFEAWFINKRLKLERREAFKKSFWANIFSTIVGIPVTWLVLLLIQLLLGGGEAHGLDTFLKKLYSVTV